MGVMAFCLGMRGLSRFMDRGGRLLANLGLGGMGEV